MNMIHCGSCDKEYRERSLDGKAIIICPYCGTVRNVEASEEQIVRTEDAEGKAAGFFGKAAGLLGRIPRRARIVGICAAIAVLALVFVSALGQGPSGGLLTATAEESLLAENETRVPSVLKEQYEDAEAIAAEAGLLLIITDKVYDEEIEADRVLSQDPLPGRVIPKGSSLKVVITSNMKNIELGIMPDVVFRTQAEAEEMLQKAGLIYEISFESSDRIQKDNIIRQSVEAGEEVKGNIVVVIVVSSGSQKQKDAVVNVEPAAAPPANNPAPEPAQGNAGSGAGENDGRTWVPDYYEFIEHPAEYTTIHHDAVYDYINIQEIKEKRDVFDDEGNVIGQEEIIVQEAKTDRILVTAAWDEQVLVKEAWTEKKLIVPGHWE